METWKQGTKPYDKPSTSRSNDSILETNTSSDESMINSLFTSPGPFIESIQNLLSYASSVASFDLILLLISSLLPSCTNLKSLQGKQLHAQIISLGLEQHPILVPKLVTFYSSFDLLLDAHNINTKPDHITMVAVLSACTHSGLVIQGQRLFEKMRGVYGISPLLEHYACMVDLFGRAGLLDKAKEIITTMPYKPTPAMWATLLGACRIHGNTEIGEWAAETLLEMRPENSGYYVLIANMYAAAGCWNKLAKVRTSMRDLGVRKAPGCAWVDVGTGFFPFVVGDTSNLHAQEIYTLLDGLTELTKDAGYVASVDFGSEDKIIEE